MSGLLLSAVLVLTNSFGSVSVDTLGARVVSYRPSDATSHLKTQGLAPDDWRLFVCIENGTFDGDSGYVLGPGMRHVLTRTLHFPARSVVRPFRCAIITQHE